MVVGEASVTVTPDSKGFGPKTKAQIEKALAGLEAKIELTIDSDGLRAKVRAAIAEASAGADIKIGTSLDTDPLKAKVAQAIADAGADVEVDMDVNTDSFAAKVAAAAAVLDDIEIELDVDSDHLRAEVTAAGKEAEADQKIKVPVDIGGGAGGDADKVGAAAGGIFGRAVLRSAGRVLATGALIQLFTSAVSGATALAGGLTAATAAAGSLVSTVAALPSLLSAAAQAAGVVALSLGGIGTALKAFSAQQKAIGAEVAGGGGGGGQSAASIRAAERSIRNAGRAVEDAQRSAADAVESANERIADSIRSVEDAERGLQDAYEQASESIEAANERVRDSIRGVEEANERVAESIRGVAEAQENLADVQESSARRVANAERDVARSHRNVQDAQEALTRARVDAREEVEELRRSVARLALTEDQARARLAEAQTKRDLERKRAQMDLTGVTEETLRALERQETLENRAAENPQLQADLELRDAELDLQEAMEDRTDAQVKLADADRNGVENTERVIDARERLADAEERLQETIAESARTQRDASRAIVDAQERVIAAQERVVDSQERVVEAQERVVDATRDAARVQRDAARDIADAQRRVADSMRDQTQAQRDLVRAQEDGARRIADAQENLADAIAAAAERAEEGVGGAAGAINRYQAALDALGPAQRRFVEFLVSLQGELKRMQNAAAEGFLPGLEDAIRTALPLLDDFEPIVRKTGLALGQLAKDAATLATTPAWRADLIAIGERNVTIIRTLGEASLRSANLLKNITVAAGPLSSHLADLALHFASVADEAAAVAREDGRLSAFFDRVQGRLDKLIVGAQGLTTGLFRIFREALPEGDRYLDLLTQAGVKFDLLTQKASESGALREFFESTREPLAAVGRLVDDLVTGLFKIGVDNLPGFTALIEQIRTELLPILLEVVGTIDADFLSAMVSLVGSVSQLVGVVLTGNPALVLFVNAVGDLADLVSTLLSDIPILSPILQALVTALGALSVVSAVGALARLSASVFSARNGLVTLVGAFDSTGAAATKAGTAYDAAGKVLGRAFLIAGIVYAAKSAIDAIAPSIDKLAESVAAAEDPLASFEKELQKLNNPGLFDKIALGFKTAFDNPIKTLISGIPGIGAVFTAVSGNAKKMQVTSEEAFKKVAEASQGAALRIVADLKAQGRETGAYEAILSSLIDEKAQQVIADEAVNRRVQEQIDKIKGVNTELDKHIDKVKAATDAALKQSNASINVEQAVDDLTDSLERNGQTFDITTQKGRDNQRQLNDLIGTIQREIEAGGINNQRKQELLNHLDLLARSGYPGAEAAANRLRLELEHMERVYTATVNLDDAQARANLAALQRELNAIEVQSQPGEGSEERTPGSGPLREFGGRVLRNAAYIVGEKRPELFVPDENGTIFPAVPSAASPKSMAQVEGAFAMPGNSQMEALIDRLGSFQEVLTDRLVQQQDIQDRIVSDPDRDSQPDVTINGPLVTIEQTFGPGSSVADLIAAMRAIGDESAAKMLEQILAMVGAGVGTGGVG